MTLELTRRIAVTLGLLLVYRLGSSIPVPGISAAALDQLFRPEGGGWSLMLVARGGVHSLSIFALNMTPFITAAVVVQVAMIVCGPLRRLRTRGERGRQLIRKITLCLTALLAAFQGYGVAIAIEGVHGLSARPDGFFAFSAAVTLAGGALLLAWLSEQITICGIGNGIALILLAGTAPVFLAPIIGAVVASRNGFVSGNEALAFVGIVVIMTGVVVLMEKARRRLPVHYADRRIGDHLMENLSSELPIKINPAGIIPVILASWLLAVVLASARFLALQRWHWSAAAADQLAVGRPLHLTLYAVFIVVIAFFYSAWLLDPDEIAGRLQQQGGAIPSVEPGESTAAHLDFVLTRITVVGTVYLTLVCLLPEILTHYAGVRFYFGGVPLLILVCTILDLDAQVRSQLRFSRQN